MTQNFEHTDSAAPTRLPAESLRYVARSWAESGFKVIPLIAGLQHPAVKRQQWLEHLSLHAIDCFWTLWPESEVGAILDDRMMVLETGPESTVDSHEMGANNVIGTVDGDRTLEYFRVQWGVSVRSDFHDLGKHRGRANVYASGSTILLPTFSSSMSTYDMPKVGQDFVDAVFANNGMAAPRPSLRSLRLAKLKTVLRTVYADCASQEWARWMEAIFRETGGSDEGMLIADEWSSSGSNYPGFGAIDHHWHALDGRGSVHGFETLDDVGYAIGNLSTCKALAYAS